MNFGGVQTGCPPKITKIRPIISLLWGGRLLANWVEKERPAGQLGPPEVQKLRMKTQSQISCQPCGCSNVANVHRHLQRPLNLLLLRQLRVPHRLLFLPHDGKIMYSGTPEVLGAPVWSDTTSPPPQVRSGIHQNREGVKVSQNACQTKALTSGRGSFGPRPEQNQPGRPWTSSAPAPAAAPP